MAGDAIFKSGPSPFRWRGLLAAAWIAVVLIAYLLQFADYVRPILALLQ
ncbi:MAG: hypothetical protein JWL84_307 [Rhodospirillales bacterium]|nr:hypothetical protein [Rhodospirillales bacterium]